MMRLWCDALIVLGFGLMVYGCSAFTSTGTSYSPGERQQITAGAGLVALGIVARLRQQ